MPEQTGRHAAVSPRTQRRDAEQARQDAEFAASATAELAGLPDAGPGIAVTRRSLRASREAAEQRASPSAAEQGQTDAASWHAAAAPVADEWAMHGAPPVRAVASAVAGAGAGAASAAGGTAGTIASRRAANARSASVGRTSAPIKNAKQAHNTRKARKAGRPLAMLGVLAVSTGLLVSVSMPAAAATVDVDAATGGAIPSAATMRSVSYQVDAGVASSEIVRDGYTATSKADVDAAASAAAAQAAAEAEASSSSSGSTASTATFAAPAVGRSGAAILAYAAEFVGVVPYGNGNDPSDSFSCDGYVQYVFKAFGVNLPRGAGAQASTGVRISASEAVAGDLLYWPEGHIGIYDGNGGMYDSPDWGRMVQHRLSIWGDPEYIRIP